MAAAELPADSDVIRLDNPEVGMGVQLDSAYELEDVAQLHAATLRALSPSEPTMIVGMSMGGLIAAILATRFRSTLPPRCSFRFIATTPNCDDAIAITDDVLESWKALKVGDSRSFGVALASLFSERFLAEHPGRAQAYFEYRARGGNSQTPKAFYRQVAAFRACNGRSYFSAINPAEASFIAGAADRALGRPHQELMKRLCPEARHCLLPDVGHMVNIERPSILIDQTRPDQAIV